MCSFFASSLIFQPQQCCLAIRPPSHTVQNQHPEWQWAQQAWREKLQEFPQGQLHPNDLQMGLHQAGKEAQGCNETLRQKIFVLASTCNSWVLNSFKSLARKLGVGGNNVFIKCYLFALNAACCEKNPTYVEISNSLLLSQNYRRWP